MSLLVAGRIAIGFALLTALVAIEVRRVIGSSNARGHVHSIPAELGSL